MKFAKGLEESIVPEWRIKYIDYRVGKKKIKTVAKVIKYTQASAAVHSLYINTLRNRTATEPSPLPQKIKGKEVSHTKFKWIPSIISSSPADHAPVVARAAIIGQGQAIERSPLTGAATQLRSLAIGYNNNLPSTTQYGTLSSPPDAIIEVSLPPPSLQLPEPLQSLDIHGDDDIAKMGKVRHIPGGPDISITQRKLFSFHQNRDLTSFTLATSRPTFLKRLSAHFIPGSAVGGQVVNVDDMREDAIEEFFEWLEFELEKINDFYREKEEDNVQRLRELDEQLYIMKNMKLAEVREETIEGSPGSAPREANKDILPRVQPRTQHHRPHSAGVLHDTFVPEPSTSKMRRAESTPYATNQPPPQDPDTGAHRLPHFMTSRDNYQTARPYRRTTPNQRDYAAHRRPINIITYRVARRRLKLALIEFYRGLELLKSYCNQNQEGFRKITKKFDKSTGLRTSKKFMSEKVNKSYFGASDVLDSLVLQTEDLFSTYFERGNRKTAVQKLRNTEKTYEFYGSTFRSGILIGLGSFAAVQGIVQGLKAARSTDDSLRSSYLLQIWGGFFLPLLSMLLFVLNCRAWAKNKINYVFCFEFNTSHNLDYHQLLELPALIWFLMGFIFWMNFVDPWPNHIGSMQYPIIFLALCLGIVFAPVRVLYHRSRRWFVYANWRLLLSGFYPVEFRDFWLGDMYCSLTYTMGNFALFPCLSDNSFNRTCRSYSWPMGVCTCVPGILRLFQCLRRFRDTGNYFPHLANAGKYACTVLYYVSLGWWRVQYMQSSKALFIAFGTINAVYCSTWDLAMDWSLLNPYAEWPFLRDGLGYKYPMLYYFAMIIDTVLRFNWIFYLVYPSEDFQRSIVVSFFISLTEILRRALWALIRMENEHCENVENFRAYREIPLPYELPSEAPKFSLYSGNTEEFSQGHTSSSQYQQTGTDLSKLGTLVGSLPYPADRQRPQNTATSSQNIPIPIREPSDFGYQSSHSLRARYSRYSGGTPQRQGVEASTPTMRALNAMGSALSKAHAQDFQRREPHLHSTYNIDDDEDEEDDESSPSEDEMSSP